MQTKKSATKSEIVTHNSTTSVWMANEVGGCHFKDVRLAKRFSRLLGMMSDGIGESVPYACQDWANTKAAYRFFSNDAVSEDPIMAGHFQATRGRLSVANQKILMLPTPVSSSFSETRIPGSASLGGLPVARARMDA